MAAEYKGFVGQKGKRHRPYPGDHIADSGGKSAEIENRQINEIVYDGRQYAEEQIRQNIPVFFSQGTKLLNHKAPPISFRLIIPQNFQNLQQKFYKVGIDKPYLYQYNAIDIKRRNKL